MSVIDHHTDQPRLPRHPTPLPRTGVFLTALTITLLLAGCGGPNRFEQRPPAWGDSLGSGIPETGSEPKAEGGTVAPAPAETVDREDPQFYKPGSDVFLRPTPNGIADARTQPDGDVKLNFQDANLIEVVKVILGDMLNVNYTIDPAVQGAVSMQTTRGLDREDLIPTLELLLRMNGAALIPADGGYRVVPLANALAEVRAPQLGDSSLSLPAGFGVRVVPLRYVAADEMSQILGPLISGTNNLLRVDSARNLLILAGTGGELERLLETVRIFDVDRMAGMSVALFTPDFVDAATLATDLEALLADPQYGLMSGLVRFIVVERLNGLLVVTPRAEHLSQVRKWITRLDRNTGDASPRLFIYRVQNGKAIDLADALNRLFNPSAAADKPSLAPGLEPATIGQAPAEESPDTALQTEPGPATARRGPGVRSTATGGLEISRSDQVQIIADEPNNALLILARGTEYRQILSALKQLDVAPMQVLIEVTIAEVDLNDNLSFGVEWFFKNSLGSGRKGEGLLDLGAEGIGALTPGFSYALKAPDVRFVLNTLAEESNLSVISSPSLLVLNNEEATINVGEEVPVATQQRQSLDNPNTDDFVNTIEYRDTGVLLNVKPRINSGGLVIMEVTQEVSQAPSTAGEDTLTPRIRQRKITSTVAVNSGDTIILGGLIEENRDLSESGIPALHKIPVLGALFGTKTDNQGRKELIVLITPRAISDSNAALQVTEEYRQRLKKLVPSRAPAPEAAALSGNPAP
jgi:general secretion pathway protein D